MRGGISGQADFFLPIWLSYRAKLQVVGFWLGQVAAHHRQPAGVDLEWNAAIVQALFLHGRLHVARKLLDLGWREECRSHSAVVTFEVRPAAL